MLSIDCDDADVDDVEDGDDVGGVDTNVNDIIRPSTSLILFRVGGGLILFAFDCIISSLGSLTSHLHAHGSFVPTTYRYCTIQENR